MDTIVLGEGPLGAALAAAFRDDGAEVRVIGRPAGGRHDPGSLRGARIVVDASRGDAVAANVEAALAAGCRHFVIATTGWDADRGSVESTVAGAGAVAVVAPNLSIGAALFFRIVEAAATVLTPTGAFEPFLVEWHRRSKRDRPSGTARELVRRIEAAARRSGTEAGAIDVAAIRAGASPGMHLVGFDAPGETIELRLTARDRSAYAAGCLAAAAWLVRAPRSPGLHPFDAVVDELLDPPSHTPDRLVAAATA